MPESPTFDRDPEGAVAELIARLPDDFRDLTLGDLDAVSDLRREIGEAMGKAAGVESAVIERIRPRLTSAVQPIGEVATETEMAELDGAARLYLGAERAAQALDGWDERSGFATFARRAGHEPYKTGTMAIEEPDGTLSFELPETPDA